MSATLAGPWSTRGSGGGISPPDTKHIVGVVDGEERCAGACDSTGQAVLCVPRRSLQELLVPSVYSPFTQCAPCELQGVDGA